MSLPFNRETMTMVILFAVILGALYIYKDLQLTKKELLSIKDKPPQVIYKPQQRKRTEPEPEEIKSAVTVADEQ